MSLYLDYRPQTWDEIVGNEETVSSLQNMLKKGNVPHTYLFVGGSGCGKTTIARILANDLGCNGNDYREINAADFRGIDSVREIIQSAKYKPLEGKTKVYMIDECHKLTTDAQNAMLKILEDTPDHVYFILATTDPQKLLATVKSRAVQYVMNPLSDMEMMRLLKITIKKEKESVDKEVLEQIIQDSMGHPRAAMNILEKVLNTEPEERMEAAKAMAEQTNESIELCRCLLSNSGWKKCAAILQGLKGQEAESIRRVVLGYAQSVLLKAENDQAAIVIEQFMEPLYDVGFPGLVFNCYAILKG
jgi:DNA polymerase III subunit gamma/tau